MANKRKTKQKDEILKFLTKNANKHLTIQEICDELEQKIGTTTVYRKINELIDDGDVTKVALNNKQGFCYQYSPKNKKCMEHYHLICEKCGKLSHFESESFEKTKLEALEKEHFNIDTSKITFYGRCEECKN